MSYNNIKVAILIPCFQEELTIAKVIADFRRELSAADIYVYDNNSTDRTAIVAAEAGAIVRREKRQGKGFVVSAMFEQIEADVFVMVDGDDTYNAADVHRLIEPIVNGDADMTIAGRQSVFEDGAFPKLHQLGNTMVTGLINLVFRSGIKDVFSGYRGFSREVALNIPLTAHGFDVETEMTLQSLYRGYILTEFESAYRMRPAGSFSKLRTFSDGLIVLLKLFVIAKSYKPLSVFGCISVLLAIVSMAVGARPIYEYFSISYVYSLPSAVLAGTLMLLAFISLALGLILNSTNLRLLELERLVVKRLSHLKKP